MEQTNLSTSLRPRIQVVKGVPLTTSLAIAEHFDKEHRNVLREIRNEIHAHDDPDFTSQHFFEATQIDARGKSIPIFRLTEIGFSLIAMGFTGARAKRWQRAYAVTFAAMRNQLLEDADSRVRELFHESSVWRSKAMVADVERRALLATNEQLRKDMHEWRREIAVVRMDRIQTQNLLQKEYGDSAAEALGRLSKDLSDAVIDALLAEERHAEEMKIARHAKGRPDFERYCASEIFLRLQVAMKNRFYSALLMWALLHLRALDTPVRILSENPDKDRILRPRAVSMRAVCDALGRGFSRDMLYQHAIRLEADGLINISHDLDRRSRGKRKVMHYQLCLEPLIERLEMVDRSALLSEAGNRTDVVLGSVAGLKTTPIILIDEHEGYLGRKSLGLFTDPKQQYDQD